jgi:hypothetical protein
MLLQASLPSAIRWKGREELSDWKDDRNSVNRHIAIVLTGPR